eukprot:6923601-Ditylum_brightwellii.AAC.1
MEKVVQQVTKNHLEVVILRWLSAEIEDRDTGLNNVNIQDIFDHAFGQRGQINDTLVDEYTTTFSAPLDMSQGFS